MDKLLNVETECCMKINNPIEYVSYDAANEYQCFLTVKKGSS